MTLLCRLAGYIARVLEFTAYFVSLTLATAVYMHAASHFNSICRVVVSLIILIHTCTRVNSTTVTLSI